MSEERRPFLRVYYRDLIRDYPSMWDDDAQLATWIRLLATADPAWPTPPELPRSVRSNPLQKLVALTLVTLEGTRFRLKGLDSERSKRAVSGRVGAVVRWESERNANALPIPKPSTKPSPESPQPPDDGREDIEAYLLVKRRAPTVKQRQLLDDILQRRDISGPRWAADIILANPDDPIGAVLEADKKWREERIREARSAERPKAQAKRRPGLPESTRDILEHWKSSLEEAS